MTARAGAVKWRNENEAISLGYMHGSVGWGNAARAARVAQAPRPNIVHIFADDLGWGSVGFNGQTQIATPNLDALAAGGMRFTNAYACPSCAASRATLYTGFHTPATPMSTATVSSTRAFAPTKS